MTRLESCMVVGAGLTGLVAARTLRDQGVQTIVLEERHDVGGRVATWHIAEAVFDVGAQFFTVREPRFGAVVQEWQRQSIVREWCRGFIAADGTMREDGHPRYCGVTGMDAIARYLARELDVHTGEKVISARAREDHWKVQAQSGRTYAAHALILTPPVPQSLALIEAGQVAISDANHAALTAITYDPCIALLVLLDGPSGLPDPGAVQWMSEPIVWMADNHRKGISPDAYAVTIHAGPEFSRVFWHADDGLIARQLLDNARAWLAAPARLYRVKRWQFSRPDRLFPERHLLIPGPPPLVFAGDAFAGPRVEGAVLSGLAAAEAILSQARPNRAWRSSAA